MKVFFTTFFCTLFLFLSAQQKAPIKKPDTKNKSVAVKKTDAINNAFIASRVLDEKGAPIGNVQIEVIDDNTSKLITTALTRSTGDSKISVPPGKKYVLVFSKSGYLFQFINTVVPDTSGYRKDLENITLPKVTVGKKIVLHTILFEPNQSILKKESLLELEQIVKLMKDNASLQIEISGHTDNASSPNFNRQFSEQRAKAVVDNLISKGCEKNRLTFKGYGSTQPIASNTTESGRQQNIRIELKVLKVDDEHDLVQHQYIYHSALKKEESIDSTNAESLQKDKDTTLAIVKQVESIDSTIAEQPNENKDSIATIVKQSESIDFIKTEPIQVSKDTAVANVKQAEEIESDETAPPQENKDTAATIVKQVEKIEPIETETHQESQDTVTIVKQTEKIESAEVKPVKEYKDTTIAKKAEKIEPIEAEPVQEKKDTTETIVKQAESIDSTEAEPIQENKETIEIAVKTEEPRTTSIVHSLKIEIKNAGQQINTPFAEYTPLLSADGHMMIFTSRRPITKKEIKKGKEGLEKVFVTYYDEKNAKWLEPKLLGPFINIPDMNNSAISLSNDGQHLFIYHAGTEINGNGEIYESQLYTEEWSEPVKLPPAINSEDNETSANISPDGRTIYFVSDRKGGLGGKDIWYSKQNEKGKWGEAVNMGESINSAEDEESVFIHPNGNVIFFSSKGHNSIGGYDIFMSVFDEITQKWAPAENLGAPINTPDDDISFLLEPNGKTGYYASSKPGGLGGLDIYNITFFEDIMKTNIALLQGRILNKNGNSVGATITVKNKATGKLSEPIKSNKTTGQYFVSLPPGKKYEIKINAYGYNTYTESIDIPYKAVSEEIIKNIVLESKNAFISSRVLDEKGNPINNVLIEVVDKATNQLIAKPRSNSAGYALVSVPFGKSYTVVFSKSGYLFQSENAVIPDSVGFEKDLKDVVLQKVEVGKKTVLSSIFFDFNHPVLRKESILEIQRVVKLMNEMSSLQIEISGHTDNVGSIAYNIQLSDQKAKAVMSNLIINGCDKNRMKYMGYGPNQPIAINYTEEGRKLNNRIELKVVKVDLAAEQIAETKRAKETVITSEKQEEELQGETFDPASDTIKTEVKNIGTLVNSPYADYGPLVSADEHTMTFTSRRLLLGKNIKKDKQALENVYVTYYDDKNEKWLEPKILSPAINLPYMNNSAVALPNDGQQMLAYHNNADLNSTGDIYEHLLLGKEWCIPVRALPKPINSDYDETSACYSPDGKTLYFVSDRTGGLGGKDIWYATQDEDGIYGEAINMGPSINTAADEEGVFIHPAGNVIFFSSKGHNSMGGFDIFMSVYDETTQSWLMPENIGLPINTYGDDVYFSMGASGKTGYYASSKPGKIGDLDIYSVSFSEDIIKKNTTMLKGHIFNKNKRPVKAMIIVKNKTTDKIIDIIKSDKETGNYFIPIVSGTKIEIDYNAYGYSEYKEVIDVPYKKGYQKIIKDIVLESNSAFIASRVLDENGHPISGVQVKVVDDFSSMVVAKPMSDSAGNNLIAVPLGKTYDVILGKPGYFSQSFIVLIQDTIGYEKDLKDVVLQKIEIGKRNVLNTVSFDLNKNTLRKESMGELQQVVKLMNETVSLQIEISGHTDSTGSVKNNQKLSELRAKTVMDSLISNGCDKNRLKFKGYGPTQPVANNNTEEGRKLNNRIELKVLKFDLATEEKEKERRMKDTIVAPVKKVKIISLENKEKQEQSQEQKKSNVKPLSERLKKYDKDNNGVISYDELLSAMDSTRTELNKVLKPEVAPEKEKEKKENITKDENLLENSDTVSIPVKKDESIYSGKEEHLQENSDTVSVPVKTDETKYSTKEEPIKENRDTASTIAKKDENINPDNEEQLLVKKETIPVKKEEEIVSTNEEKKKVPTPKPLPERFKIYDKDNDGLISYNEILRVIDAFLDEPPNAKGDAKMVELISEMIDFYFDQ